MLPCSRRWQCMVTYDSTEAGTPAGPNLRCVQRHPTSAGTLSKPAPETTQHPASRACASYLNSMRSMKSAQVQRPSVDATGSISALLVRLIC